MCMYMRACVRVCVRACVRVCMRVCVHACVYEFMLCVHVYRDVGKILKVVRSMGCAVLLCQTRKITIIPYEVNNNIYSRTFDAVCVWICNNSTCVSSALYGLYHVLGISCHYLL